jgi:hypothetical protein
VAYEEDDDIEDPPTEALPGSASPGGESELAQGLLLLCGEILKMGVLLTEADEEAWKSIHHRYTAFRSLVAGLPSGPTPRRKVGFKVEKRKRKTSP